MRLAESHDYTALYVADQSIADTHVKMRAKALDHDLHAILDANAKRWKLKMSISSGRNGLNLKMGRFVEPKRSVFASSVVKSALWQFPGLFPRQDFGFYSVSPD